MIEAEPWSYHPDGSPVYSLADIIRKRSAITPARIALTEAGRTTAFAELDQRSSQVAQAHPAVAEVAVVGVPSAEWGESPYAVVVLRPDAEVSEAELIAWVRDRLARYKCPVGVSFVPSLARTASGKLQKQAIRASLGSVAVP